MRLNYIDNIDCLEGLAEIPDRSVDLIVTDPPYDIHAGNCGGCFGDRQAYLDIEPISNGFSEGVLDELCRVLKKINIYLFCSQRQIIPLLDYFVTRKGCNWTLLTWHKTNPVPACKNKYLSDTEFILFFRERGVKMLGDYKTKFTYYTTPIDQKTKKLYGHPTIKPLGIVENFIQNSSKPGDVVLDPFIGTGTTAVAAIKTGRNFVGFELDEKYHAIAMKRIEEAKVEQEQEQTIDDWMS